MTWWMNVPGSLAMPIVGERRGVAAHSLHICHPSSSTSCPAHLSYTLQSSPHDSKHHPISGLRSQPHLQMGGNDLITWQQC